MKSKKELDELDHYELVNEVLYLQKKLNDLKVNEAESAYIHNYHFTGLELLNLDRDKMIGGGLIITLHSLKGVPLIKPTLLKDGLSTNSVNSLLDDLQYSYNQAIKLKPATIRL